MAKFDEKESHVHRTSGQTDVAFRKQLRDAWTTDPAPWVTHPQLKHAEYLVKNSHPHHIWKKSWFDYALTFTSKVTTSLDSWKSTVTIRLTGLPLPKRKTEIPATRNTSLPTTPVHFLTPNDWRGRIYSIPLHTLSVKIPKGPSPFA